MPKCLFVLSLGALLLVLFAFPGDVPFLCDEPLLIENALNANEAGILARQGIQGSMGAYYGPPPTWFYQAALSISRDLIVISVIKHALSLVLTLSALSLLWWRLRLPRVTVFFFLLAPAMHVYLRQLWDNSLLIPLGAWLLALACEFLQRPRHSIWWGMVALSVLMGHIHLMTGMMIAPALALTACRQTAWLKRHWRSAGSPLLLAVLISLPYLRQALTVAQQAESQHAGGISQAWRVLAGAQHLTFAPASLFYHTLENGRGLLPLSISTLASTLTNLALPLFVIGLIVGLRSQGLRRDMTLLSLAVILATALFHLTTGHYFHLHYINASWPCYLLFIGFGCELLLQWRAGLPVLMIGLLASALLFVAVKWDVHQQRRMPTLAFGVVLSEQQKIARTIAREFPGARVATEDQILQTFPQSIQCLRRLAGDTPTATGPVVVIVWATNASGRPTLQLRAPHQ